MNALIEGLDAFVRNLQATLTDPSALWALVVLVIAGAAALGLGTVVARWTGLLLPGSPMGERFAIGITVGLIIAAAWIAAIASGGRSAFTPVAVTFVVAILLGVRNARRARDTDTTGRPADRGAWLGTTVVALVSVVAIALLYGATIGPSPRDGAQPVEFMDEAFYAILGRDIVASGTEAFHSPSGFSSLPGLPVQTWYHWGELWLTGAADLVPGVTTSFARHLVTLPLLVVALAALTGSIARHASRLETKAVFAFGAVGGLLLAPVPVIGNYFSTWASGMLFSIVMYGLAALIAAVVILVALQERTLSEWRPETILFAGGVAAMLLPAHVGLAVLAALGTGVAVVVTLADRALLQRQHIGLSRVGLGIGGVILAVSVATVAWGVVTGHTLLGSGKSVGVQPYNEVWQVAVSRTVAGSLCFAAIAVAWLIVRKDRPMLAALTVGALAVMAGGAVAWGLLLAEFTMFHVFYGAIAVFGTPIAVASIVVVWERLRVAGRPRLALALIGLAGIQLSIAAFGVALKLAQFSPGEYPAIPLPIVTAIRTLPPDARIAYACHPYEEIAFWDSRLLSIDLHTGRRVVSMCFQANGLAAVVGGDPEIVSMSPQFQFSPQSQLFADITAAPSPSEIANFMRDHGIDYIYVDAVHPNTLVPGAVPVAVSGDTQLLKLP